MPTADKTAAPFIAAPETKVKTTIGVMLALAGVVAGATASGVAAWIWTQADVRAHEAKLIGHDTQLGAIDNRVRVLENAQTDIAVMRNDVHWIRQALERQQAREDAAARGRED